MIDSKARIACLIKARLRRMMRDDAAQEVRGIYGRWEGGSQKRGVIQLMRGDIHWMTVESRLDEFWVFPLGLHRRRAGLEITAMLLTNIFCNICFFCLRTPLHFIIQMDSWL
jgi:hypothetical protein